MATHQKADKCRRRAERGGTGNGLSLTLPAVVWCASPPGHSACSTNNHFLHAPRRASRMPGRCCIANRATRVHAHHVKSLPPVQLCPSPPTCALRFFVDSATVLSTRSPSLYAFFVDSATALSTRSPYLNSCGSRRRRQTLGQPWLGNKVSIHVETEAPSGLGPQTSPRAGARGIRLVFDR